MKFLPAPLTGAWWIDPEPSRDERGSFGRIFEAGPFEQHSLCGQFPQVSLSLNTARHTLRGMHYQEAPHGEIKLVTCVRGAAFDVIVDARPESPNRWQWMSTELTAANQRLLYVPVGFAHGFLSLEPDTTLLYQIAGSYLPEASRGLRWNDPKLGIVWPASPAVISNRDRDWPLVTPPQTTSE